MEDWTPPQRPADLTEKRLIQAILNGDFAAGSTLPGERDLATRLGVTRPTLREALQRLARDGWIEIRQGKATRVNDFWWEGNLNVLSAIARFGGDASVELVPDLLAVRQALAPAYAFAAVTNGAEKIVAFLTPYSSLPDLAEAFAVADWDLHLALIRASENPIFMLIYNSFQRLYLNMARRYFAQPRARSASRAFYQDLLAAAMEVDPAAAQEVVRSAMEESRRIWLEAEK
jgi:GntR family negative regulator for fad regulon and positive regulator of fabA